jgi:ABC-type multidrug transport system ATPase subunit
MRTIATPGGDDVPSMGSVCQDKESVRRRLGYLPQEFGVYPEVTAEGLLDHLAVLKGFSDRKARKSEVDALLHQTNLYEARKKKLGEFSGGMKQRFGIAQALLGNPALIIVDEPTAGLDPQERNRFLNLLSEIGRTSSSSFPPHRRHVGTLCRMAIISRARS